MKGKGRKKVMVREKVRERLWRRRDSGKNRGLMSRRGLGRRY